MPLPFNQDPEDQASLLETLERIFPAEWWQPMKLAANAGYELLATFARVGERVAQSAHNVLVGLFAMHARGGQKARVMVELHRPTAAAGAVEVLAGTVVTTSRGDRRFVLLAGASFGALDLGPHQVEVEAQSAGWEWNVQGEVATAGGEVLPGEIDRVLTPVTDPAFGDPTIAVRQVAFPHVEGRAQMLDLTAGDRGVERDSGESDESLSTRARILPDTVSPAAIRRLLAELLGQRGIPYDFIEVHEHRYQECWDAPSPNVGTPTFASPMPTNPDYDHTTFVYDDPRDPDPFRNRWMDGTEWRGTFVVVVPNDVTLLDVGLAYDDFGMVPDNFHPPGGPSAGLPWRGSSAYDAPTGVAGIFAPAYDGFDVERQAIYVALRAQLEAARAAGVVAIIVTPG